MGKFDNDINSVLSNFITRPATDTDAPLPQAERVQTVPKADLKTRRVQLLVTPTDYEAIKRKAEAEGISINEAFTRAIREYVK